MGKKKILMVEDNANVLHLNRSVLERRGYYVYTADCLKAARPIMKEHPDISAAVLDIILPDGDGLVFAGEVKRVLGCPVLMLTSKGSHDDVVKGLGAADAYLTKPYRIEELTAHVQALIQKQQAVESHGPLVLDTPSGRAFLHGEDLLLQPREFGVLACLVRNQGCYISAQTLYEAAWKLPLEGDAGAVKTAVSRLRSKLENSGYTIDSRRGEGYCFREVPGT